MSRTWDQDYLEALEASLTQLKAVGLADSSERHWFTYSHYINGAGVLGWQVVVYRPRDSGQPETVVDRFSTLAAAREAVKDAIIKHGALTVRPIMKGGQPRAIVPE